MCYNIFNLSKVFLFFDILTVFAVPAAGQEGKDQSPDVKRNEFLYAQQNESEKKAQELATLDLRLAGLC